MAIQRPPLATRNSSLAGPTWPLNEFDADCMLIVQLPSFVCLPSRAATCCPTRPSPNRCRPELSWAARESFESFQLLQSARPEVLGGQMAARDKFRRSMGAARDTC